MDRNVVPCVSAGEGEGVPTGRLSDPRPLRNGEDAPAIQTTAKVVVVISTVVMVTEYLEKTERATESVKNYRSVEKIAGIFERVL